MAANHILDTFLAKNGLDFQSFYKDIINDSIDISELGDALVDTLKKSINSTRFWTKKLEKFTNDRTLIFTTFSTELGKHITYLDIFEALSKVIELKYVKELYQPENQRYIGIILEDAEKANYILENFKKVGDSFIVFTNWIAEAYIYKGKIHWLPNAIDQGIITNFLNNYFVIKSVSKGQAMIAKDMVINTNVFLFEGLLRFGVSLKDIPHLTNFNNDEALITIKGRPPLCLSCNKIGHIKAQCDYVYCKKCRLSCLKSHNCLDMELRESYAHILRVTERSGTMSKQSGSGAPPQVVAYKNGPVDIGEDWINVKRGGSKSNRKVIKGKDAADLLASGVSPGSDSLEIVALSINSDEMLSDFSAGDLDPAGKEQSGILKRKWNDNEQIENLSNKVHDGCLDKSSSVCAFEVANRFDVLSDEISVLEDG